MLVLFRTGKKAMARLLGIVHMNPETPRSAWSHVEVSIPQRKSLYCFGCICVQCRLFTDLAWNHLERRIFMD
jgi:hypothetical protein